MIDSNEKLYVYAGSTEEAIADHKMVPASFKNKQALRKIITLKQAAMGLNKSQLMIVIKPGEQSRYSNIVDALDEMLINDVKRYAVVAPTPMEINYLKEHF